MDLEKLFEQFVKERRYLQNVTPKTVSWYRQSFKVFQDNHTGELSKASLAELVFKLREKGMSVTSVNVYMRTVNSFLSWLHENQQTKDYLRINN
jgi:integrase/recombinase XerD